MTTIHSNSFRELRNPEFVQQGKDLAKVINDSNPTTLLFKKHYDYFNSNVHNTEEAYKLAQKNPLTQSLVSIDTKRDNIFMAICFIVDAHLKHWNPAVVEAATLIKDSIELFGRDLIIKNYQAESADIASLLNKWTTNPKMAAALTLMNIDSWKNELKTTNDLFIATYNTRSVEDGNAEALPKLKLLKNNTMQSWKKLQTVIEGKVAEYEDDATKAPLYAAVVNSINGVLDNYSNLIAQRKGKNSSDSAAPIDTPE